MGKHEISLSYVQRANRILGAVFVQQQKLQDDQNLALTGSNPLNRKFKNLIQTIVTSYHNTAVEHEYLKDYKQALAFYLKAFAFANKYLGADDPLTKLCQANFLDSK